MGGLRMKNILPTELWLCILSNLEYQDLKQYSLTCKRFNEISKCNVLWRRRCLMDFDASDILSVLIERNCNDLDETLLASLYDPHPLKSWKNVYLALYHKQNDRDLHGSGIEYSGLLNQRVEYCIPDYLNAALLDQISIAKQAAIRYPFRSYLGSIPLQPERTSLSCTYSALLTRSVVRSFDSFDSAIIPSTARFQPLYQQELPLDLFRQYYHNNNYDNYRLSFQVAME